MVKQNISFVLNGEKKNIDVDVRKSLLELIRVDFGLTGAKEGCGVGECGACAVLIDGVAVDTCIYLAVWADGKEIRTVEGLAKDGQLNPMQKAFVEKGAVQCGFCTPGFIITATEMAESDEEFTHEDVKLALSGHLCRCTGYTKIVEAAKEGLRNSRSCNHDV